MVPSHVLVYKFKVAVPYTFFLQIHYRVIKKIQLKFI